MVALCPAMEKLTKSDIAKIAKLAQIEILDSDLEQKLVEFKNILAFTDKLSQIELTDSPGENADSKTVSTPLSKDEPRPSLDEKLVFENAPDRQDHFFKVPRMLGDAS